MYKYIYIILNYIISYYIIFFYIISYVCPNNTVKTYNCKEL